jgi:hypothetical protein
LVGFIRPQQFGELERELSLTAGGLEDFCDVDEVHLSAVALPRGVYDYGFAVSCGPGMGVYSPFALVFGWEVEAAEVYSFGGFYVEEVWGDESAAVGVCVAENPFVAGEVCAVAVAIHYPSADNL